MGKVPSEDRKSWRETWKRANMEPRGTKKPKRIQYEDKRLKKRKKERRKIRELRRGGARRPKIKGDFTQTEISLSLTWTRPASRKASLAARKEERIKVKVSDLSIKKRIWAGPFYILIFFGYFVNPLHCFE